MNVLHMRLCPEQQGSGFKTDLEEQLLRDRKTEKSKRNQKNSHSLVS